MTNFMDNLDPVNANKKKVALVQDNRGMDEIFMDSLPDSLYLNHYELHDAHPQFLAKDWRRFLKEKDRFISQEITAVTEANARKALNKLSQGRLQQGDISAITNLLNRSEQLNKNMKAKVQTITTFLPDVADLSPTEGMSPKQRREYNKRIADVYFPPKNPQVIQLYESKRLIMGDDGLVHVNALSKDMTHIERVYVTMHNKYNRLNGEHRSTNIAKEQRHDNKDRES